MAHEVTWDSGFEIAPAGSNFWEFGASKLREFRKAEEERLGYSHEMDTDFLTSHGLHRYNKTSYTTGTQSLNLGQDVIHCIPVGDITLTLPTIASCNFTTKSHGFLIYVTKTSGNSFTVTLSAQAGETLQINSAISWVLGGAGQACYVFPYNTTTWCVMQYSNKRGSIIMWSGLIADIPYGWYLCDGTNGTPNLKGKFLASINEGVSPFAAIGEGVGGEKLHILTENEMPAHTHGYYWSTTGGTTGTAQGPSDSHDSFTEYAGSGVGHNNLPLYYVLAFLFKD